MGSQKKKKIWLKVTGIILLVLFVGVGAYAFTVYKSLTNAVNTMHQPVERATEKRPKPVELEEKDPFSVLMLGVDERKGDRGRSDTIIVLTVNPNNNSVKMLSIPRDTRTEIIGKGFDDKINHAYAFGGVTVNIDLDFTYEGVHFSKGALQLSGADALKYSRMRYDDPRGDFGRQTRQRQIIQAVIKEGASVSSLTNFSSIFTALGNNVKTVHKYIFKIIRICNT